MAKTFAHDIKMTNHQLTFSKIKELLKAQFSERVSEFENGTYLTLDSENENESSIWIELNKGGRFIITDLTKIIGILLILTLPAYVILKKKYFKNDIK